MFQSTWLRSATWDTPLGEADAQQWSTFERDLPCLKEIRVERRVPVCDANAKVELHGFADASERAYAALCAASLLTKLVAHLRQVLGAEDVPIHLWSDSTVALGWIRGHPHALPGACWHHLPGKENPADCASRGISPSELVHHLLWWKGPLWLSEDRTSWPSVIEPEELTRFSSLNRLVRVTAWCRRWKRALAAKHPPPVAASLPPAKDTLSASECDDARLAWIRVVQTAAYKEELRTLARGASLPNRNNLVKLVPFSDPLGILRVGGRIKHALLAYDERHPAILPGSSHLTQLIIEACHRRTMHGGVQLTLGTVRQHYWIPRGRQMVKAVIHRCVTCARWRGATQKQIMGDLPRLRVTLPDHSCELASTTPAPSSCARRRAAVTALTRPSLRSSCASARRPYI
ncbi:hypothetical protein ACFW04_011084 [Cataglyphis niger]